MGMWWLICGGWYDGWLCWEVLLLFDCFGCDQQFCFYFEVVLFVVVEVEIVVVEFVDCVDVVYFMFEYWVWYVFE